MPAPATNSSQSTGRSSMPPAVSGIPSMPAASGAVAGNLHLTPAEQEAVAAYLARIWPGATGLNKVPAPDMLAALVETTLRKAREQVGQRER